MFNRILNKIKEVWNTPLKPLSFQIAKWYDTDTGESGYALVHCRDCIDEKGEEYGLLNIKHLGKGWIFAL